MAISRAQALAIIVGSPELPRVRCRTVAEMKLVNLLCASFTMRGRGPRPPHRVTSIPHPERSEEPDLRSEETESRHPPSTSAKNSGRSSS